MTSKHVQKHHIKKQRNHSLEKIAEMAKTGQKWPFLTLEGLLMHGKMLIHEEVFILVNKVYIYSKMKLSIMDESESI